MTGTGISYLPTELIFIRPASSAYELRHNYSWSKLLIDFAKRRESPNIYPDQCSDVVVPVKCFQMAPLRCYMKYYSCTKLVVEVPLSKELLPEKAPENAYWFARVLMIAGYRLLLRYVGIGENDNEKYDFWLNIGSRSLKHVGYCGEDPFKRRLIEPRLLSGAHHNHSYYREYLSSCRTVSFDWFSIQEHNFNCCKFVVGNRVELLDAANSSQVRPAFIMKIAGHRIFLKLSVSDIFPEPIKVDDEQLNGIWLEQDSPLIFYVGWSLRVGYGLCANSKYRKHARRIADAIISNRQPLPLKSCDASPHLFEIVCESRKISDNVCWQKGMELEFLDPVGTFRELRCGVVIDVLPDGYLAVGFNRRTYDVSQVPILYSSPLLFPVGYANKYGIKLRGLKGEYITNHKEFCKNPAPEELFDDTDACTAMVQLFQIGAKLEAVDMCDTKLICPASVASHRGRVLEISFDSSDVTYNQIFDFRSSDLMPVGWCEIYGYRLEHPLSKSTFSFRMKNCERHARVKETYT